MVTFKAINNVFEHEKSERDICSTRLDFDPHGANFGFAQNRSGGKRQTF